MPARITTAIPPRSYELVRDNVGRILATEILEQFTITSDQLFNTPVYIQRSKPIQPSETSLVIVSVGSGAFDNQTVIDSDGTLPIFIDCFCTSAGTDDDRGDVLSSYKVQRLAGVVMGILEHPEYKTLDFAPPFIMGSHVGSFETGTLNKEDSTNTSVVRIVLNVRASQIEPEGVAIPIASTGTQVTLGLTPLGYAWGYDMPPLPPPVCSPVRIYNTNTTYDVTIASGGFLELPNTPVDVVDSFGTVLGSGDVPSVTGGNIVISTSCADGSAVLKDTDGNTISTTPIPSGQTVDVTAPNGTVTATNSEATTIGSTTVLSNGTANIPISDSAITLNSSAFISVPAENSQNIILVDQNDIPIIPISVISNEVKVNIPISGALPSGIYTPKNVVSGAFDLLWENQTANVVTGDGFVEKISDNGAWNGSATFLISHNGDFTMSFTADPSIFWMAGFNRNKINNSFEQLENSIFCFPGQGISAYEKGLQVTGFNATSTTYSIERIGNDINYKVAGVTYFSRQMSGAGGVLFDCSINGLTNFSNIQVVIP